ncbi:serine hydrolase domain-containing protein [Pseudomonadota bacterium AL_CKDN230030165-1A_HGKHYDSX7]
MSNQRQVFENQFFPTGSGWATIQERMAFHGIPGASIAFVADDTVAWRAPFGVLQLGDSTPVQADTPFQAASLSKPHASIGVQRLFAQRGLDLDSPLAGHTSWAIPCRTCGAQINWSGNVTVKQTLQHMGGFIGAGNTNPPDHCSDFDADGGGFDGYVARVGAPIPTLGEILAGTCPANSPPIELTLMPGEFHYSGMGYVALMRMLLDMTGEDFHDWMRTHVLAPMKMESSSYALGPPTWMPAAASGHVGTEPIEGKRNFYPESAAAGLYSNAGDLCQTIIMLNNGGMIDGTPILSPGQAAAMLDEQIGIFTYQQNDIYYFDHLGENKGFTAYMRGYPHQHAGFALMINQDHEKWGALKFLNEAIEAFGRVYGLPVGPALSD